MIIQEYYENFCEAIKLNLNNEINHMLTKILMIKLGIISFMKEEQVYEIYALKIWFKTPHLVKLLPSLFICSFY